MTKLDYSWLLSWPRKLEHNDLKCGIMPILYVQSNFENKATQLCYKHGHETK